MQSGLLWHLKNTDTQCPEFQGPNQDCNEMVRSLSNNIETNRVTCNSSNTKTKLQIIIQFGQSLAGYPGQLATVIEETILKTSQIRGIENNIACSFGKNITWIMLDFCVGMNYSSVKGLIRSSQYLKTPQTGGLKFKTFILRSWSWTINISFM